MLYGHLFYWLHSHSSWVPLVLHWMPRLPDFQIDRNAWAPCFSPCDCIDPEDQCYSCRQTKSSNLLTNFLGFRKASELVDNGINEFLLTSLINSNKQNFQKQQYKCFIAKKIGQCLKKIAKNMKNIPISTPFCFLSSIPQRPSEILIRNLSPTVRILLKLSCDHTQVKVSEKKI